MRTNLFILGIWAAAALATASCAKEKEADGYVTEADGGIRFEIVACSSDTKTVNDGLSTRWTEGDAVNVFHAVAGSKDYINDGEFTLSDAENGKFIGSLASALDPSQPYDWYVYYPYNPEITSPENTSGGYSTVAALTQSQTGDDSKAHLAGLPLAGKTTTDAGVLNPTVSMKQLAAVIKVVVTNNAGANLPVTQVTFTSPVSIAGDYRVSFEDPASPVYTEKSGSVGQSVTLNTICTTKESGESVFYFAVKPFEAAASSTMTLKVNNYEKSVVLDAGKSFSAGIIYPFTFNYNAPHRKKTFVVFGDSISEVKGYDNKTWCDHAEEITGDTFINLGIGGTKLASRTSYGHIFNAETFYARNDYVYHSPDGTMKMYRCMNASGHQGAWKDSDFNEVTAVYYMYTGLDIVNMVTAVTDLEAPIETRFADVEAAAECVYAAKPSADKRGVITTMKAIDWTDVDGIIIMAGANDFANFPYTDLSSVDPTSTFGAISIIVNKLSSTFEDIPIYNVKEQKKWFEWKNAQGREEMWCDNYYGAPIFDETQSYAANSNVVYPVNGKMMIYRCKVPHSGTWNPNHFSEICEVYTYGDFLDRIVLKYQEYNIPTIDLYEGLGWNMSNFSNFYPDNDGSHPLKGFRQIAECIVRGLLTMDNDQVSPSTDLDGAQLPVWDDGDEL